MAEMPRSVYAGGEGEATMASRSGNAHLELWIEATGLSHGEIARRIATAAKALGVLTREVGDAAGGWLAFQRGVSAVVIVGV